MGQKIALLLTMLGLRMFSVKGKEKNWDGFRCLLVQSFGRSLVLEKFCDPRGCRITKNLFSRPPLLKVLP